MMTNIYIKAINSKPGFLILFALLTNLFVTGCIQQVSENSKKTHPSHEYKTIDTIPRLNYSEILYVPVYSDIYHVDGTRRFALTTTLSIRNTSQTDSAYILATDYYDSYGRLMKKYLKKPILLIPLESIEYVVEGTNKSGGAGANFIVEWGAKNYSDQLLVQSVMIGTTEKQGISFLSEAKVIESSNLIPETNDTIVK
ncbi:MAG: DUF3124 domain-containing protein [Prolixibacteraceae bacterium]|nr:DUF3124 domain-containing protein [Prolixibacteraceae bacterium]